MRFQKNLRLILILLSLFGALFKVYAQSTLLLKANAMSGTAIVKTAFATDQLITNTYCLGRFIISVPVDSKVGGGLYKYNFAIVEEPVRMTFEQFKQEVAAREEKLRSIKHKKEPNLLRTSLNPSPETRVLAFFQEPYITAGINVEGYKWVDGMRFLLRAEADPDKQSQALNRMISRLSDLRPRANTEVPSQPGYCFAGGFIANPNWENEEARFEIGLAGHPDAYLSVWLFPVAAHKRDKPLLERMGGVMQQLGTLATGVHVLRQGDRTLGEFKGQEHLVSAPNSGGMRAHAFIWETEGEGTLQDPHISIRLSTGTADSKGNPQRTRLTDEQAIKLWDSIVGSFRLRPVSGGPAKTSDATPPKAPLGDRQVTGRTCPQTGWWVCDDALELAQPAGMWLTEGQAMPRAAVWAEPTLWERLKGERPQGTSAAMWRLAAYEAPPGPGSTVQPAGDAVPPAKGESS